MTRRTKPDALAEGITERLRVAYSGDLRAHLSGGQYNRLTRRLNSLARVAGLGSANDLPFRERHKVFLEACARGFGDHPAAEELLRVLAELEHWARGRAAPESDADPWRELRGEFAEFLEELGAEGEGGGPDGDLWTFVLETDAMSPELRRGVRLLYRRGAEPREGECRLRPNPERRPARAPRPLHAPGLGRARSPERRAGSL